MLLPEKANVSLLICFLSPSVSSLQSQHSLLPVLTRLGPSTVDIVESLLSVCHPKALVHSNLSSPTEALLRESQSSAGKRTSLTFKKANPKLAYRKDDDGRLPIHWAVSYGHLPIVELLVQTKRFDPDVEVRISGSLSVECYGGRSGVILYQS